MIEKLKVVEGAIERIEKGEIHKRDAIALVEQRLT